MFNLIISFLFNIPTYIYNAFVFANNSVVFAFRFADMIEFFRGLFS